MLSSISPFGERARGTRWWETTTFYVLGSVLGGVAVGALLGGLGSLLPDRLRGSTPTLLGVGILLLVGLALDLGVRGWRLPSWRRQVEREWLGRYRAWALGLGFGVQLGLGVVTIITSSTTYAVLLAELLSGRWWAGLIIGTTFGLVRSLPLLAMIRVQSPADLHSVFAALGRWAAPVDMVARSALVLGAGALTMAAILG